MKEQDWTHFESYTRQMMEEHHIPGMAVAVTSYGEKVYEGCFGVRNLETGDPVTPDTVFGIASVSKSFTAMAIMQLVDRGMLCPDDPVVKHLPEFRIRGVDDMNTIRIHHLLSHTTGLPPFKRRQDLKALSDHINYIATAEYELLGKPSEYFSYCNDSFLVLGAIIERVTGMTFREYMKKNVFSAIGMPRTSHSPEDIAQYGDVTVLYNYNRETGKHEPQEWPDLGNYHVSGGIRSSIRDLVRYASVYALGGQIDGRRIISEHSIWRMRQPVYEVGRGRYYAYGLQVTPDYCGLTLVEHGGSLPGVSSHFGYVPERGVAAAVLTNVRGVPAKAIWLSAVNVALGLPLDQKASVEPYYDAPLDYLKRYIGTYSSAEGGRARVFLDGDTLKVETGGEVFPVRPSDERRLVFEAHGQEMVMKFYTNPEGQVWAVFFGSRMLRREKE